MKVRSASTVSYTHLDVYKRQLAADGGNDDAKLLAEACSMANNAGIIVKTLGAAWGGDIETAINNKLKECSVSGTDVDAKVAELQSELTALIG